MKNRFTLKQTLFLLTLSNSAFAAFDVTPISVTLGTNGPSAVGMISVSNSSDAKIPVQISIIPRNPDINGKENHKDAPEIKEDLFKVVPKQLVLAPNEKRTVQIVWKGPAAQTEEQSFRFIAEELPFDVEDPNKTYTTAVGAVKIASKYIGSIYVAPAGVAPKVIMTGKPSEDSKSLILDIENKGSAHYILQKMKISLQSAKNDSLKAEIKGDQIKLLVNQNVLARKTRRFSLPWPNGLPIGPLKVTFENIKE